MAANNAPIFTGAPFLSQAVWLPATTANTDSTGVMVVGTSGLLLHTPGANGSFLSRLRAMPGASTVGTATNASVIRVFLSTVNTGTTTTANTKLYVEVGVAAQTSDSATLATQPIDIPLGFAIPSTTYVLVTMHTAATAATSWQFTLIGGNY
jgi:hypothetical protein